MYVYIISVSEYDTILMEAGRSHSIIRVHSS